MDFSDMPVASQFNGGVAIIYILSDLKKAIISDRDRSDYQGLYKHLLSFHLQLTSKMGTSKKEGSTLEKIEQERKICRSVILKLNAMNKDRTLKMTYEELECFDKWEFELLVLEQVLGLGMPKGRDPRFAMSD